MVADPGDRERFLAECTLGGQELMGAAVQFRTHEKYKKEFDRWCVFVRRCLPQVTVEDLFMEGQPIRRQVQLMSAYIFYCYTHLKLKSTSIYGCLSGLRHHFRLNALPLDVFGHPSVVACKSALSLRERQQEEPVLPNRRYPLTLGMVLELVQFHAALHTPDDDMVGVAVTLAFFCLLRSSEYVPNHRGAEHNCCHALLAKDVEFEVGSDTDSVFFDASEVRAHMWPHVLTVKFTLRSAKNDKLRMGSVFWFRNIASYSLSVINVVKTAFEWALKSRPSSSSYFLSRRMQNTGYFVQLRYSQVARAIKMCAVRAGFQAGNFGTHSARVGGACTLRAGGASDSMIQLLGRWKNINTALCYTESGKKEFDIMQEVLSNPSIFTTKDIRLLHGSIQQSRVSSGHAGAPVAPKAVNFAFGV